MKNFRLKKEATPFFKEKHATAIYPFDTWNSLGVDPKALEEVEPAYLTYGHRDLKNNSASLSGWNGENGSHFHFTVVFPSCKYLEHDKFTNGKVMRKLMDRIQSNVDHFYSDFINEETEE